MENRKKKGKNKRRNRKRTYTLWAVFVFEILFAWFWAFNRGNYKDESGERWKYRRIVTHSSGEYRTFQSVLTNKSNISYRDLQIYYSTVPIGGDKEVSSNLFSFEESEFCNILNEAWDHMVEFRDFVNE